MSFVYRLLLIVAVVTLLVGATVLLVAPGVVLDLANGLLSVDTQGRVIQLVLALLIDLLLLGILYRLLRPTSSRGLIVRTRGARTDVSIDSVRRQIMTQVSQLPDVLDTQTEIRAERGNARVTLRVKASPDITVPDKQNEINRALRQVVEKQMGLRLAGPPAIHIELATPRDREPVPVEVPPPPAPRLAPAPLPPAIEPERPTPAAPPASTPRPVEPEKPAPPPSPAAAAPEPAPEPYLVALEPADEDEDTDYPSTSNGWQDNSVDNPTMRLGRPRDSFDEP